MAKKRFNGFLLIRLAGIALFIFVLARTDLRELWQWMKVADPGYLLAAIFFQLLVLFIKAWRWYILNEEGYSRRRLLRRAGEFFEGYAIGVITPGRVGEMMKAGHAGSRKGILGAGLRVIAERGTDLCIFIIIGGTAIVQGYLPGVSAAWGWMVLLLGLAGAVVAFLILVSPAVVRLAERLLQLLRLLPKGQGLEYTHCTLRKAAAFLFWSIAGNASYFVCCYLLASGLSTGLAFINVAAGVATAGVVNTLPVTVMGLGTREVTLLYVFSELPRAQVMAFSGLVFLVGQVGGGVISLILGQIFLLNSNKARHESV